MKLAWWSPWPPQRSGVAGRSAEVVPLLAARGHAIDVFVHGSRLRVKPAPDAPPASGAFRVIDAHEFVWRHRKHRYDLPVYQVGNSHLHRYIWPYLFRYPGLAVLHDARVHHARAEALLAAGRAADYRAEFAWSHPTVDPAAANFGILGLDGPFYFQWPMIRGILETSRVIAAHSVGVAASLRAARPDVTIEHIGLGEGARDLDPIAAGQAFRRAHQIPDAAVVFGVYGGLTAEKRLVEILDAFSATLNWVPDARLLLAGAADPVLDLEGRIAGLRISDRVIHLPALGDEAFDGAIAAADVVLSLRWPTALETSGPWVRSLALGRTTVILDLPHQSHLPTLDPRTWRPHSASAELGIELEDRAIAVAIELRDLGRGLRTAMRRLGSDATLRAALGADARRWWEREHTMDRMVADYERVLSVAASHPAPSPGTGWPSHLVPAPSAYARALLGRDAWADETLTTRLAALDS